MKGDKDRISPIMTNSESIHQFGNNAYGKPATAMNILRETIMGRELFDYAFKMYSNRWMFNFIKSLNKNCRIIKIVKFFCLI